ncbi:hypothetical protein C0Q70_19533 [Pomacea canaliculata]|uniref:Uncharacterized protein n=1 Tax=Pomacea canaliculata TaxID=400727 RepID=A0A2T7NJL1_POMCA|nr:hypothetical protein C0Q70_19533 [Pomacea canaliculata]
MKGGPLPYPQLPVPCTLLHSTALATGSRDDVSRAPLRQPIIGTLCDVSRGMASSPLFLQSLTPPCMFAKGKQWRTVLVFLTFLLEHSHGNLLRGKAGEKVAEGRQAGSTRKPFQSRGQGSVGKQEEDCDSRSYGDEEEHPEQKVVDGAADVQPGDVSPVVEDEVVPRKHIVKQWR